MLITCLELVVPLVKLDSVVLESVWIFMRESVILSSSNFSATINCIAISSAWFIVLIGAMVFLSLISFSCRYIMAPAPVMWLLFSSILEPSVYILIVCVCSFKLLFASEINLSTVLVYFFTCSYLD